MTASEECPKCGVSEPWVTIPHIKRSYEFHCLNCGHKWERVDRSVAIDTDIEAALRFAGAGADEALKGAGR